MNGEEYNIKRLKKWLNKHILPAYIKAEMDRNEEFYQKKIKELERDNARLTAYINGLETGLKAVRRITINNNAGSDN